MSLTELCVEFKHVKVLYVLMEGNEETAAEASYFLLCLYSG